MPYKVEKLWKHSPRHAFLDLSNFSNSIKRNPVGDEDLGTSLIKRQEVLSLLTLITLIFNPANWTSKYKYHTLAVRLRKSAKKQVVVRIA